MTVFAGIAEFERDLIRKRTGAGREAAKQRGVRFGPPKLASEQKQLAWRLLEEAKSATGDRERDIQQAPRAPRCWPESQTPPARTGAAPTSSGSSRSGAPSAQTPIKLIGDLHLVGGTHLLDRSSSLPSLRKSSPHPPSPQASCAAGSPPKPAPDGRGVCHLHTALPADLQSMMARHLTPTIQLQPGALVITGADSTEIFENLCLLAQALHNDLATIQTMLDPPPKTPSVEQDEPPRPLRAPPRRRTRLAVRPQRA